MSKGTYSATRCRATWKPRISDDKVPFFSCNDGKVLLMGIAGDEEVSFSGEGRTLIGKMPYASISQSLKSSNLCSDAELPLQTSVSLPSTIQLDYQLIGGYNNNALVVSWCLQNDNYSLSWIALKTFTGMQLKYNTPRKINSLTFAFAAEDAYAYCDKDPCQECVFMCKRGFIIYAMIKNYGVVEIPLTRVSLC